MKVSTTMLAGLLATIASASPVNVTAVPPVTDEWTKRLCGGLFNKPMCCTGDVLGLVHTGCAAPYPIPSDAGEFITGCYQAGKAAQCCTVNLLGNSLLCNTPTGVVAAARDDPEIPEECLRGGCAEEQSSSTVHVEASVTTVAATVSKRAPQFLTELPTFPFPSDTVPFPPKKGGGAGGRKDKPYDHHDHHHHKGGPKKPSFITSIPTSTSISLTSKPLVTSIPPPAKLTFWCDKTDADCVALKFNHCPTDAPLCKDDGYCDENDKECLADWKEGKAKYLAQYLALYAAVPQVTSTAK